MKPISAATMVKFAVASTGSGMFNAFFNSALPLFLARYPLPLAMVGLLAQERSILGALLEPVVGAVSDRTSTRWGRRRPFFLIGAPLAALFLILLAQQPSTTALILVLLCLPLFLAIANVPYRAMMADIAPPQQRGRLGGIMALLEMVGQVGLLYMVSQIWGTHESLVFYVIAAALLLSFGFTFFAVDEPRPLPPAAPGPLVSPLAYLQDVLALREAAKYVGSQLVFWLAIGGITPFITRYAVSELGMQESDAFLILLLLVALTAALAVPAGFLGDRLGKKRVLLVALAVYALAVLAGSQARTVQEILPIMAVVGIANGFTTALGFALLTELLPRSRMGELTGLSGMTWSFAQPLGSMLAGLLADLAGTLRVAFLAAGLLLLVSLLILAFVQAPAGRAAPAE